VGFLIASFRSYVPGFELASVILLVGILAYWFVIGELKPREI
jgi:NADH:ubiquinone oxidoreductase subunit 6 (subunit J)